MCEALVKYHEHPSKSDFNNCKAHAGQQLSLPFRALRSVPSAAFGPSFWPGPPSGSDTLLTLYPSQSARPLLCQIAGQHQPGKISPQRTPALRLRTGVAQLKDISVARRLPCICRWRRSCSAIRAFSGMSGKLSGHGNSGVILHPSFLDCHWQ